MNISLFKYHLHGVENDEPLIHTLSFCDVDTGVSKNKGTPKWMVYNGTPYIPLLKFMIWGYPYFWKHPYSGHEPRKPCWVYGRSSSTRLSSKATSFAERRHVDGLVRFGAIQEDEEVKEKRLTTLQKL